MADPEEELRRAREEAEKAREEANRLRNEARDLARRLAHEARDRAREERERSRHHHGPHGPGGFPFGPGGPIPPGAPRPPGSGESGPSDAVRVENAFTFDGVRYVTIDQTAGRLTVRPCAPGETPGAFASSGRSTPPRVEVHRELDRLIIEVKLLKGWLFRRKQGATTVVRLGEGFETLKVNLGYGNLELRDLVCESVKADVGAGEIQAYAVSATLDADLGAGKIAIHDHAGLAKCDVGTGDVLLDIAGVAEGEYRVNVGMGRAEIRLAPGGGPVHVRASSGIGRARVEVPSGPENSATRVKVESGIGEVVVRYRPAGQEAARPPATAKPQRGAPRAAAAAAQRSREAEQFRVLQLLEQGRISSQDAAELIAALQGAAAPPAEEGENGDDAAQREGPPPSPPAVD